MATTNKGKGPVDDGFGDIVAEPISKFPKRQGGGPRPFTPNADTLAYIVSKLGTLNANGSAESVHTTKVYGSAKEAVAGNRGLGRYVEFVADSNGLSVRKAVEDIGGNRWRVKFRLAKARKPRTVKSDEAAASTAE